MLFSAACHSSSLMSVPSVVSAFRGWSVRPSRAIMVSSTVISVEMSRASEPYRLSYCFSKAATTVRIMPSTLARVESMFSPETPAALIRS